MVTELKDLIHLEVGEEKAYEFALWAFGEGFLRFKELIDFADAWNERHSDLYEVNLDYPIVNDIIMMAELWRLYE